MAHCSSCRSRRPPRNGLRDFGQRRGSRRRPRRCPRSSRSIGTSNRGRSRLSATIPQSVMYDFGAIGPCCGEGCMREAPFRYSTKSGAGTVTARVPHPLQFNKPRTTTGEIANANRREIGQHITLAGRFQQPAGSILCFRAGRRSSTTEQLFVKSLTLSLAGEVFPFDELAFPRCRHRDTAREHDRLQRRRRHDVALQQENRAGAALRYSAGKKEFTPTGVRRSR